RESEDLAPLRPREDFRALVAELGRPSEVPAPSGEAGELRGHDRQQSVMAVAVSRGGRRALTGGHDRTARLWDLATEKEVRRYEGHTRGVLGLAVSADGERALSGGYDGTVRLWEVKTGKEIHRLEADAETVNSVALAPDGRRAASGGADGFVRLWDLDGG